jgi:predicted N-acetyltransferase YhbS
MASLRYLPQLDDEQIALAASQHHAFWGGTRSLDEHVARVREQVARSDHMRYVGLADARGALVCSLKRYRLRLMWGEAEVEAVGIGAVFTPEAERRRGYAAELLRRLLAEASEQGAGAALLFSDIDVRYYERLGFLTLSHLSWSARRETLPTGPASLGGEADLGTSCDLFERSWAAGFVRSRRDVDSFAYWAWLNRTPAPRLLLREGEPCGYVCASANEGTLWIDEAVTVELDAPTLWASLRQLADEQGAARVGGWLRPDHAGGPFVASARSRCIPMAARLDARLAEPASLRAHFSSLDHF